MKKTIAVLLLVLLLTGCAPSEPVSTNSSDPTTTPSETVSIEPTAPDPEEEAYYALQAEFEQNIALVDTESWESIWSYSYECLGIFEEMLNYRQSVDDFNESMEVPYGSGYGILSIDIWPVLTDGDLIIGF